MIVVILILVAFILAVFLFVQQPKFGKPASGERLAMIKQAINYRNGSFVNISHTPSLAEGHSFFSVLRKFFFYKVPDKIPADVLPSAKADLKSLGITENVLLWFGHSSYFLQVDGKRILVDPVFSGAASPIPATTQAFKGSDVYAVEDMPDIDYLFLSHDHWDHLDYETILKLKPKVKMVVTGYGVGAHLEYWGYQKDRILEKNWGDEVLLGKGFAVNITSGRHFSGRGLRRNKSVWLSFALKTPTMNLFLGGDSGYDKHFKEIGEQFGPFDLAILECGQYNQAWKYIHMMPEEVVRAGQDLKAKNILPVHWAKFALSVHAWKEPIARVTASAQQQSMHLVTPMIGEVMDLNDLSKTYPAWWEKVN